MAIATIAEAIARGDISVYLSGNDNAKGALNGNRINAPLSPITILMVTDALRWGYASGAYSSASLREVTNYLIWLVGIYGMAAQAIIDGGSGGGSVIPGGGVTRPNRIDWITDDSSFIVTGGDTVTIPSFIGWNLEFDRDGVPQSALVTEPSYFRWNRNTGVFSCFPALEALEVCALIPV